MPGIEKEINPRRQENVLRDTALSRVGGDFFYLSDRGVCLLRRSFPDGPNAHRVLDPWKTGLLHTVFAEQQHKRVSG